MFLGGFSLSNCSKTSILFLIDVSAKFPLPSSSENVRETVQMFLIYSRLKRREGRGDNARMQILLKEREENKIVRMLKQRLLGKKARMKYR